MWGVFGVVVLSGVGILDGGEYVCVVLGRFLSGEAAWKIIFHVCEMERSFWVEEDSVDSSRVGGYIYVVIGFAGGW